MTHDYYFYNTDGGQGRFDILIHEGFAATGGPAKFGEELGQLNPEDVLLMYENSVGVVAVGTVTKEWNRRTYKTPKYYPRVDWFDNEYRIDVDWFLDLSDNPLSYTTLKSNIGYIPRGAIQKIVSQSSTVESMIDERLSNHSFYDELSADDADNDDSRSEYTPRSGDGRRIVTRQIRERRGQKQFRDALLARYDKKCVITNCAVLDVLEAAHIKPYRRVDDHNPQNGLLLRADIHTLFDLNLSGIEPESLTIRFHPTLLSEYGNLDGITLLCHPKRRPSSKALKLRYRQFQKATQERKRGDNRSQ